MSANVIRCASSMLNITINYLCVFFFSQKHIRVAISIKRPKIDMFSIIPFYTANENFQNQTDRVLYSTVNVNRLTAAHRANDSKQILQAKHKGDN